jgi:hypothetical protein
VPHLTVLPHVTQGPYFGYKRDGSSIPIGHESLPHYLIERGQPKEE